MFLAEAAAKAGMLWGMTTDFWVIMLVFVLFIASILTSSYNEDKTKGL